MRAWFRWRRAGREHNEQIPDTKLLMRHLDDDQRWVPTHVNVTVLRARGLRTKGKHGSRYLYTIIQVGKEKYTTGLVEKAAVPEWNEECCFELLPGILEDGGRSNHPSGSGDLVLTVMHRVLIGLDVFLGQTIIPLDKIFQDGICPRDEWFKLNSKAGRKEKERGELQVTVQFTRNNMTASMFDLTMKDKPRSAFGKLKDRVTGKKRCDMESSSAIVPGRYAALSGSLGQPFGQESGGVVESRDVEIAEEKKSKVKDFFKGRLRKSSDTKSCSSLASDSSVSSIASDNPGPPPSLGLLSDPPSSPIYTSKVRVDTHYGEADLAKKVLTSQHTTKVLTHKRAFSDEASKITTAFPRANTTVESLKGQTMTQSKSSLCINGSHVYDSEPSTPKSSGTLPSKLVLLEKCSPLSRSLQNLTKRSEDRGSFAEGRRWSFDKMKKDEKEEEKESQTSSFSIQEAQTGGQSMQAAMPTLSSVADSSDKGRKLRKTLFSGGRSDSLPAKTDVNQAGAASEGRLKGWFGSGDSQNKPRLEVSPKVESSSDVSPPFPPHSPVPPHCSSPSTSPTGHASPNDGNHTNPITPPSNPFLPRLQRNPFFEELIAEESQRSPPYAPCSSSGSSPFHYTTLPSQPCTPSSAHDVNATNMASIKRERPRPVARQISLPALLPKATPHNSPNHSTPHCMSESAGEWEDSFDAFASSRLNSPKGSLSQRQLNTSPTSPNSHSYLPVNNNNHTQELQKCEEEPPPLPPRRLLRTPVNEIFSDGWLHRGQELAVHKEACLLSQTGAASLQRGKEGECKRNTPSVSPDPNTSSETSDSLNGNSQPSTNVTSPGCLSEEKIKKFKYEPLEDETDCWGGMLFEQDLYGRVCRGNYVLPKVNNHHLSLKTEETAGNKNACQDSGPKMFLDSEVTVADLLKLSSAAPPQSGVISTPVEEIECSTINPAETICKNNNMSFSLTLGDLNMNVNNLDFSFIDSDGSSQSEVVDTLKGLNSLVPQESQIADIYQQETTVTTPEDMFTLKDTYIPDMNSSFEISALSNKLCKVSPVCQGNCQDCRCELNNVAPHLNTQNKSGEREFEQLLSLVKNISEVSEGPLSYQPTKSALSSLLGLDKQANFLVDATGKDQKYHDELNTTSQIYSKDDTSSLLTGKPFAISFEDLHAKVAPNLRTPSKSKIGQSLQEPEPSSPIPSALSLSADAQDKLHPTPVCCPSIHPSSVGLPSAGASTSLAMAPYTSSSSSYSTTFTTDQPLVDARHSLLPEETQPASNLPHQESRPHPVKPLTSSQSEKKDGRSVLEKLKSTIHPGRTAHQAVAEPERSQEVTVDNSAHYQHLTNMELISLLLQQEMDMQKQQAASEQQGAQLEKCGAELKKVKAQVRDLEDYIDNLLLRIMEQTPTLLQVRTRHK
ncbi:rab11 family-interacting protein 1 [Scomber scombrus]|uniref:Rab11 family-interacting protein 1 n=1 Tax=Scomber scombrus TaxID=13677 RepID=A0AAV1P1L7_SCOSC